VVILRPVGGSAELNEAATRLGAELRASGFQVRVRERHPDEGVLAYEAGAVIALDPRPLAAISVGETDGELAAALWRIDPETGQPVAWSVSVRDARGAGDGAGAPAVLALRAVELLHASLTRVVIDAPQLFPPPPPPAPPPAAAVATVTAAPPPPVAEGPRHFAQGLSAAVGPAVIGGRAGLGVAPALRLMLGLGTRQGLLVRGGLAALGGTATLTGPGGAADVRQRLLGLDVGWVLPGLPRLQPAVFAGAGALHTAVRGRADPGHDADQASLWAVAARAGASAALRLNARLSCVFEAEAVLAEPGVRVRLLGVDTGRAGRPSFVAGLSVLARL
jgi:hypothetical protein